MRYRIATQGRLNASWSQWFGGMQLAQRQEPDGAWVTTLDGEVADQAELRGILTRLLDLNITLLAVRRLDENGGMSTW
jgi:hypothetical protein